MAKEWVLNIALNRWQLNRPKYVGKVSEEIRKCQPKKLGDWVSYYNRNVKPKKYLEMKKSIPNLDIEQYLGYLGQELCKKIHEVLRKEIEDIKEEHCIEYIKNLVLEKTFEGFQTELDTVYKLLEKELNTKIYPAPDEWDRKYNIDFYIKAKNGFIGIQIKPITYNQTPEVYNWKDWLQNTHEKFEKYIGGKAFVIFSIKKDNKKVIYNKEVIQEIDKAIKELGWVSSD